jgi:Putative beta barrel porin-7 (BBP7)
MSHRWLATLGICIITTVPLFAQEAAVPDAPANEQTPSQSQVRFLTPYLVPDNDQEPPAPPQAPVRPPTFPPAPNPRIVPALPQGVLVPVTESDYTWFRAEALVWWVKDAPLPVPIAAVTDASGNSQTVIGNSNIGYGAFSGARLVLGSWFDQHNNFGFESSFFTLARRTNSQTVSDDGSGKPSIGLSYLSASPGQQGETIQYLSSPGTFTGNILVSSDLELWGAEINGALCLVRTANLEFTALAGFRYVDLGESLDVTSFTSYLPTKNFLLLNDQFSTRNQFYGGQLGASVLWNADRLCLDATGKIALGGTNQVVDIQGNSFASKTGSTILGGFYAQPSNIGRYTANQFGVIPSVELKLSYRFFRNWRAYIGYDFMYWNQVVRPGNQIDRNVNLTQSPFLGSGMLSGSASPSPLFSRSDFWAQGMTFGLEFRF